MTSGSGMGAYFGSTMAQAGKSGTTTSNRDLVFAGYTPYYTCVIWGGHDDNSKQDLDKLGYTRLIWKGIMERVHKDLPYKDFEQPDGIITADVCNKSGLLPIEGTCDHTQTGSTVFTEYFEIGTLSSETCNHHITLDICQATGKIASSDCPASQVIQKVFIYDASAETDDGAYVVSEEFLNTVCPHKKTPSSTPDNSEKESEKDSEKESETDSEDKKNNSHRTN